MRSFLLRLGAHVHKEARDQRAVFLGVALALPVLTFLAFWAFGDRLSAASATDVAGAVLPVALILFVLGVASDLGAGEVRRGTVAFLRRTPNGLSTAFFAKAIALALGAAAILAWQAAVLLGAHGLLGAGPGAGFLETLRAGVLCPPTILVLLLAGWVFLASTWLRHGGVAIVLAPLLAGALGLPAVLWARSHALLARWLAHDLGVASLLVVVVALLPLLAAGVAFVRGRRHVGSGFAAVVGGLAVLVVLGGSAYAYAGLRLHGLLDFAPGDADVVLAQPLLSPSGRVAWLEAARVLDAPARELTATRAWRIDLSDGAAVPAGDWGEPTEAPRARGTWGSLVPQPRLVRYRAGVLDGGPVVDWLDAESGAALKTVPVGVDPPDVSGWRREAARLASRVRDAQGRRVWLRASDGAIEREGEEGPPAARPSEVPFFAGIPGGWLGYDARSKTVTLDATSGEVRTLDRPGWTVVTWLSPAHGLAWGPEARVFDLATGESAPVRGRPAGAGILLGAVDRDRVLVAGGGPGARRATLWNPVTGEATVPAGLSDLEVASWYVAGFDAEDRQVWLVASSDGTRVVRWEPDGDRATVLGICDRDANVFALREDGSVYVLEAGRRIVRYGPAAGQRAVLFPR